MSNTAPQTRHTVTAIIVAHDGARLLPALVQALQAQTYPVERVVGVDTGSRDRSGSVLADLIGQDAVFGMDRHTGYGEAVAVALRHGVASRTTRTDPNLVRVEWIWLLHDDCEPTPETLERLLRAASRDRSVVVLGPKVLDGSDRRVLREAGVSIDRAGRRITGIEPGEIDQGQHDANRAVMAVGSAGMLVRRDVWDRLGGFDTRLKLFRDDLDFCWRVQAAGLRVQVVTDAVLYHRELSARRRRTTEGRSSPLAEAGRHPRRLDRRNALYVLAVNLPLLTMLRVMAGCVVGSLVRAGYFLLTKQLDLAAAQIYAIAGLFGHPIWLWKGRRRRAATRREGYAAVRTLIPPGRTLSRLAENIAGLLSSGPPQASGGMHQAASEEPEDEQFVDTQSVLRRVIANPGVRLVIALLVVALVAERRLLGTSPLGGGALVPAWGGASGLWSEYLAGFHSVSVGSTASAPAYLAVVAALATVLGGQAWLAVDVLLLGCVPLAGLSAYLATRRLVSSTAARMWLAASYAFLPVAAGAVAAGRLGSAFAFAMLPLIGVTAGRMLTAPPRAARRAAWATGLLVALAAAFAPIIWLFGAVFAVVMLAVWLVGANTGAGRWLWPVRPVDAVIVVATPFVVLFPWSLRLFASPSSFFAEAGVVPPGLITAAPRPSALMLLNPGGPGLAPVWVTAGIGLAVIAALLPHRRTAVTVAGWCVAAVGFLGALAMVRATIPTAGGGHVAGGWPGPALAVAGLGLLLAAAPAADWLVSFGAGRNLARKLPAGIALAAAATAPLLAAGYWLAHGVRGPVGNIDSPVLPAFVAASSGGANQYRTLILRPAGASLDYSVIRQSDPILGEPELAVSGPAEQALSQQVAALAAPNGADAGDPGLVLGTFGIRWVLLPGPVDPALAQRLDAAVGLVPKSKAPAYDLWQVAGPVARVRVVAPDGAVTTLASQAVGMPAVSAPAAGGTVVLAEPLGGWTASLNGRALKPLPAPVDGWAQGFTLPAGGGKLVISRNNTARDLSLIAEFVALLTVCVLALPGKRAEPEAEAEAVAAEREARVGGRAARAGQRSGRAGRARLASRAARAGQRSGLAGRAAAGLGGIRKRAAASLPGAGHGPASGSGVGVLPDIDESDDAGQWDEDGQWDDDGQVGGAGPPDRRGTLTGPQHAAPRGTGPQRTAPRDSGPQQPAPWEADPHGASWDSGPQPAAPWGTDPRAAAPDASARQWSTGPRESRGTRPQESRSTGPRESRGTGPQRQGETGSRESRGTGPQESWDGPRESWGTGPQQQWGTGPQRQWNDGPRDPRGTGPQESWDDPSQSWDTGPQESWQTSAQAPARENGNRRNVQAERHSHRATRHGRPGRRRGLGDRSGRNGSGADGSSKDTDS